MIWDFFRIFLCHTHELSYCACLTREAERKSVFRDICAMADVMESLEAMDMERFKLAVSKCSEHTRDLAPGVDNADYFSLSARLTILISCFTGSFLTVGKGERMKGSGQLPCARRVPCVSQGLFFHQFNR